MKWHTWLQQILFETGRDALETLKSVEINLWRVGESGLQDGLSLGSGPILGRTIMGNGIVERRNTKFKVGLTSRHLHAVGSLLQLPAGGTSTSERQQLSSPGTSTL